MTKSISSSTLPLSRFKSPNSSTHSPRHKEAWKMFRWLLKGWMKLLRLLI